MLKRLSDFLAGTSMTLLSGIFLGVSLVLSFAGITLWVDPAWGAVMISGIPLLYLAVWRIVHNPGISKISSALLITMAMFAAIAIGDVFAAGEVAFIMAIGAVLEDKTAGRARRGLKKLASLVPLQARRIRDCREEMISASQIAAGDMLRILPGETIPVDGEIISGETAVDQSVITGEALPADKEPGDSVFCGTMNCFGAIDICATKVGEDSSLQQLVRIVQEAERNQAPMQRIADKWASYLTPLALLIAVLAYLGTGNTVTAVTVLVVFCPCALVLATPVAVMAAIGQATRHGVIVKSGEALEKMGKVDTIAFDKTGTLTLGRLAVSDVVSFSPGLDERTLLAMTAASEARSGHPLGKAVVACARERGIVPADSAGFRMEAGKGIFAEVSGKKLLCGSRKFLAENGVVLDTEMTCILEKLREQGKAVVLVADGSSCIGAIALSDVLRPAAKEVVSRLASMGVQTVLLTGDNGVTARYFAKQAGITAVYADLLPADKAGHIARFQKEGRTICMIGDGINDAPALKAASVGVAMGGVGSDMAVESAGIVLMRDDMTQIPYLKRLSGATVHTIKFSIGLSLCINAAAIALSFMAVLTPTTGALVHNAGSCLVVLIAALLYDRQFE